MVGFQNTLVVRCDKGSKGEFHGWFQIHESKRALDQPSVAFARLQPFHSLASTGTSFDRKEDASMCLFQAIKVVNCFYFAVLGLGRRQSSSLGSQAGGLRFSVKPTRSSRMMAPPGTTPRPQHRKTSIFINMSMDVKKSSAADNIDQYTGCKNRVGTM